MVFGEVLFIYIICKKRRADFRQKCYSLPRYASFLTKLFTNRLFCDKMNLPNKT